MATTNRRSGSTTAVCRYCRHGHVVDDIFTDCSIYSLRQASDDQLPATYAEDSEVDGTRSRSASSRTPSRGQLTTDTWARSSVMTSLTSAAESAILDLGDDEVGCGGGLFSEAECHRCGHHHHHHHHHHHPSNSPQDQFPTSRSNLVKQDIAEYAVRSPTDDCVTSRTTAY
jgi:hypothetical protein